jgi:hypothetical protein
LLQFLRSEPARELLNAAAGVVDDPFAVEKLCRRGPLGGSRDAAIAAVDHLRLRLRAAEKFAWASQMWFTAPLLEQASGDLAARHHAARISEWARASGITGPVGDLCCGLGSDGIALAAALPGDCPVLAIDQEPLAVAIAQANAEVFHLQSALVGRVGKVPDDVPSLTAFWADPSRRQSGKRSRHLDFLSPSLAALLSLAAAGRGAGIKLSPATPDAELDPALEGTPHVREFVSIGGECRELVLWLGELAEVMRGGADGTEVFRVATLVREGLSISGVPESYPEVRALSGWLLEPDPALIRSGLVANLAREVGAWGLDPHLAYLGASEPVHSPWFRAYRVGREQPFSARALAQELSRARAGNVVLKTRGSAVEPEALRFQLRAVLKQGSPDRCPVVFVTRIRGRPVMMVGERFGASGESG